MDNDNYQAINTFTRLFLQTYEDCVGNMDVPIYGFWLNKDGRTNTFTQGALVWIIWVTWFTNQWFIFIILLNFIIAIISHSYDSVMAKATKFRYLQRADMNLECRIVMKFFSLLNKMDQFVLAAHQEEEEQEDDEFGGFVKTIEKYVVKQREDIFSSVTNDFQLQLHEKVTLLSSQISNQMDHKLESEISRTRGTLKNANEKVENLSNDF